MRIREQSDTGKDVSADTGPVLWRRRHVLGLPLLLLLAEAAQPQLAFGEDADHPGVTLRAIGRPSWEPVDFNIFSAPIGRPASFAQFQKTNLGLLPLHAAHPQLGVGPGKPHQPPYTHELSKGVNRADYVRNGPFVPAQFSNGRAVYLDYMTVPRAGSTVGSSPDFARGPIISNALFPIHIRGTCFRNGKVFDAALVNIDVPPLNDTRLTPSFAVDGASHFPVFIADNAEFGPTLPTLEGRYVYRLTMLDNSRSRNGWSIEAVFRIAERGDSRQLPVTS